MKKLFLTLVAVCMTGFAMASWTVAGSSAGLNGTADWNPAEEANDMTLVGGLYTLVVEDCTLEVNTTYQFKVVKDHKWGEEYPSSNYNYSVTETAVYTVTYTFDESTKEVGLKTEKKGAAGEITHTYTVAGSSVVLFGGEWNPALVANDMTLNSDGNYVKVYEDVELAAGDIYYKICQDHAWAVSYGKDGGNDNAILNIAGTATYTITITFNPETHDVSAVAETDEVITYVYSIAGDEALLGANWDETLTSTEMTESSEGVYELVLTNKALQADTYGFKVVVNHAWAENYPAENALLEIATDGIYDVTFTFTLEDKAVSAKADLVREVANEFGLLINTTKVKATLTDDVPEGYTAQYVVNAQELAENDVIQLYHSYVLNEDGDVWTPAFGVENAGAGENFATVDEKIVCKKAAKYNIYIKIGASGDALYIEEVVEDEPTALKEVMIDIDQPMYNLLGQKVNADYKGVVIQNGQKFILK